MDFGGSSLVLAGAVLRSARGGWVAASRAANWRAVIYYGGEVHTTYNNVIVCACVIFLILFIHLLVP